MKKSLTSQASDGLRRAGAWLLGFAVICVLVGGLLIVFFPDDIHLLGIPGPYPKVFGWMALVITASVLIITTHRWVKALPGIFMLAALNSLTSVFTGHLPNSPNLSISHSAALTITALLVLSAALAFTFRSRELNLLDQLALLVVVFSLAWGVVDDVAIPTIGAALFALFFAWFCARLKFHIPSVRWAKR
jgi:hypothetical protein